MEELELLLQRRSRDPRNGAVLLPVFYDMTWDQLQRKAHDLDTAAAAATGTAAAQGAHWAESWRALKAGVLQEVSAKEEELGGITDERQKTEWAANLNILKGITGLRTDQVGAARHNATRSWANLLSKTLGWANQHFSKLRQSHTSVSTHESACQVTRYD
jgi:hypothetical protein